ncbi:MAG: redoxin domain-containing protein [Proteobacteria bacterium]|nr:redoxin domain-containing protein [Pseudomonadota bacterium]
MTRSIVVFCLLASLFTVLACGTEGSKDVAKEGSSDTWVALKKGKEAKPFTLKDLEGKDVSLSDYKGKIIFLNFWATWCPPCRKEMPSMEALQKIIGIENFVILAVATDRKGEKLVRPFVEEKKISLKVLIDDKSDVSDLYGVVALPTTYIIGRDAVIIEMVRGGAEWDDADTVEYFKSLIDKGGAA